MDVIRLEQRIGETAGLNTRSVRTLNGLSFGGKGLC
jgi:hypothetical protein